MEGAPLSLILDVVILVLLGLTIVYAARLSLQLRRLRDSKSEMDQIVRDLVKNVDRADQAVRGLKETARAAGGDLQNAIDRAVSIADELEVVNESGNRLAARLESLLDAARPVVSGAGPKSSAPASRPASSAQGGDSYAQHLRKLEVAEAEAPSPRGGMFAIRDGDAERGLDPLQSVADDDAMGLYSEAERDLFRAMKSKTKI